MSTDNHSTNGATAAAGGTDEVNAAVLLKIIETLRPLSDDGRLRTVDAALRFLGTVWAHDAAPASSRANRRGVSGKLVESETPEIAELPRRVQVWLAQNELAPEALTEVFHRTASGVELIANQVPGPSNKDRTIN